MRTNDRLQRTLRLRRLDGGTALAESVEKTDPVGATISDLKLFAMTFAGGFLFMTIFLG